MKLIIISALAFLAIAPTASAAEPQFVEVSCLETGGAWVTYSDGSESCEGGVAETGGTAPMPDPAPAGYEGLVVPKPDPAPKAIGGMGTPYHADAKPKRKRHHHRRHHR